MGTRWGQDRDKTGKRQGKDMEKTGTTQGKDRDKSDKEKTGTKYVYTYDISIPAL